MQSYKNFSVVVQGPIDKEHTHNCLNSIRKHAPNAFIILSTWKGSNVSGLNYDELVLSEDPGFFYYSRSHGAKENNVNRQIVSTLAGLKKVTSEYVLKIRTDFLLNGIGFLDYLEKFNLFDENYHVFQEKILSCCYFARNPSSKMSYPFHISDIAFFGKTSDIINLYDIPLMTRYEAYWNTRSDGFTRYVPEQYIFINCLRKNKKEILCHYFNHKSQHNIMETEKYFASNFVFLTFDQFNIIPTKKSFSLKAHPNIFRTCYTHIEWLTLYKKHADPSALIPEVDSEREKIERYYKIYKKYRLLGSIVAAPFWGKNKRIQIRRNVLEYFLHD